MTYGSGFTEVHHYHTYDNNVGPTACLVNCCIHQLTVVGVTTLVGAIGLALLVGVSRQRVAMRSGPFTAIYSTQVIHKGWYAAGLLVGGTGGFIVGQIGAGLFACAGKTITYECCLCGGLCLDLVRSTK